MKYEYLPEKLPSIKYSTYKVFPVDVSTDNVKLDGRYIYYAEDYIKGMKNITVVNVKGGVLIGGMVIGGKEEKADYENPDLTLTVKFNNIEILDKKEIASSAINPNTNQEGKLYSFKLKFKYTYQLIVQDPKNKIILLDTIVETPKTTIFPNDYKFDQFGNKVGHPGYFVKSELDLAYNQASPTLYAESKKILAKNCMDEVKVIVNSRYGYNSADLKIDYYWVKSKNKLFDICDSTIDYMRAIVDTMSTNERRNAHINWHCVSAKKNARQLIRIWEMMLNDSRYLAEFKDPKDLEEYTAKMKRNLVLAYLFNDDFTNAKKYFKEIENKVKVFAGEKVSIDPTLVTLQVLVEREEKFYPIHKDYFGFK